MFQASTIAEGCPQRGTPLTRRRVGLVFFVFFLTIAMSVVSAPARASDGNLSSSAIALFPKEMGNFAYADWQAAQKSPFFSVLFDQILPAHFKQLKLFAGSAGIDFDTQVQEIAWGTIETKGGEEVVGVVLGQFNPSDTETRLKSQQVPMVSFQGYHMYALGTGDGPNDLLFLFLDANTVAFGYRSALEHFVNVRMGGEESLLSNDTLYPLIRNANGSGVLWAIFDQNHTQIAIDELVPQAVAFPQAAATLRKIHGLVLHAQDDSGAVMLLQAKCDSVNDANLLALALQAEIMYTKYERAHSDPGLADLLGHITVLPSGDELKASVQLSAADVPSFLKMGLAIPQL